MSRKIEDDEISAEGLRQKSLEAAWRKTRKRHLMTPPPSTSTTTTNTSSSSVKKKDVLMVMVNSPLPDDLEQATILNPSPLKRSSVHQSLNDSLVCDNSNKKRNKDEGTQCEHPAFEILRWDSRLLDTLIEIRKHGEVVGAQIMEREEYLDKFIEAAKKTCGSPKYGSQSARKKAEADLRLAMSDVLLLPPLSGQARRILQQISTAAGELDTEEALWKDTDSYEKLKCRLVEAQATISLLTEQLERAMEREQQFSKAQTQSPDSVLSPVPMAKDECVLIHDEDFMDPNDDDLECSRLSLPKLLGNSCDKIDHPQTTSDLVESGQRISLEAIETMTEELSKSGNPISEAILKARFIETLQSLASRKREISKMTPKMISLMQQVQSLRIENQKLKAEMEAKMVMGDNCDKNFQETAVSKLNKIFGSSSSSSSSATTTAVACSQQEATDVAISLLQSQVRKAQAVLESKKLVKIQSSSRTEEIKMAEKDVERAQQALEQMLQATHVVMRQEEDLLNRKAALERKMQECQFRRERAERRAETILLANKELKIQLSNAVRSLESKVQIQERAEEVGAEMERIRNLCNEVKEMLPSSTKGDVAMSLLSISALMVGLQSLWSEVLYWKHESEERSMELQSCQQSNAILSQKLRIARNFLSCHDETLTAVQAMINLARHLGPVDSAIRDLFLKKEELERIHTGVVARITDVDKTQEVNEEALLWVDEDSD